MHVFATEHKNNLDAMKQTVTGQQCKKFNCTIL